MPLYGSLTVTNPDLLQVPITPLQILDASGKPSGHIDPTQWNVFIQTLSRVTSNPGAFSSGTGFNYIPINYSQYNDGALPTMSGTATVTYDTGFHIFGAASLKVTNSGTVYFASTSTTYPFGIAPSLTWIISAYCKSDVASAGGTIGIKTATGTYSVPFTASAVAGDTTRIYGILDLSADTGTAFDVEIVSSAGAGKNIWFDGFMLEPRSGSSDVPSPYSTNTPSTVLNVDPSGGVINTLPLPNHAGPVTSTIVGTADANGNYLAGGSTSALTDDANFSQTAAWGGLTGIADTIAGHNLTDVVQPVLPSATQESILANDGSGNLSWQQQFGSETNIGYRSEESTVATTTGSGYVQYGSTVVIPNPGKAVSVLAIGSVSCYTLTNGQHGVFQMQISTDGGSTWTSGNQAVAGVQGVSGVFGYFPATAHAGVNNVIPTGNIYIRMMVESDGAYNVDWHHGGFLYVIGPQTSYSITGGTLAASLPSTASTSGSVTYPTTTGTLSKSLSVTVANAGVPPDSFSNSVTSGSGTITSGATSQTFVVTSGTLTAGTPANVGVHSVVTDSTTPTPQTVTTNTCTVTFSLTQVYSAISASLTETDGLCSATAPASCTATGYSQANATGGNGSYTYSHTIHSSTHGLATITAGATSQKCTVSESYGTAKPPNVDTLTMWCAVNDTRSTGSVTATGTLTLTFKSFT